MFSLNNIFGLQVILYWIIWYGSLIKLLTLLEICKVVLTMDTQQEGCLTATRTDRSTATCGFVKWKMNCLGNFNKWELCEMVILCWK